MAKRPRWIRSGLGDDSSASATWDGSHQDSDITFVCRPFQGSLCALRACARQQTDSRVQVLFQVVTLKKLRHGKEKILRQ